MIQFALVALVAIFATIAAAAIAEEVQKILVEAAF